MLMTSRSWVRLVLYPYEHGQRCHARMGTGDPFARLVALVGLRLDVGSQGQP